MPSKSPFNVIHLSGQDENFPASELNTHSPTTKGWQSSRFCLYPQDIVIQLEHRAKLRKIQMLSHQYLIATKIEFYVGDVAEGLTHTLDNIRYTRLGYVALSNNEKTGFQARELKSVHVDAVGMFVKFVIHKNHVNKHNLYNQVGIIALNVIGEDLSNSGDTDSLYPLDINERQSIDRSPAGALNRPDYISPLDDLAFDMYQDPEVAQIIREMEKKKQSAVLEERYDYAKRLKGAIQDLQKAGEKLGKYEVEKRQAVENEDYDKAKLKKIQMDEYRMQVYQQINIDDLLETTGKAVRNDSSSSSSRYPKPVEIVPTGSPVPARLTELPRTPPRSITPRTPYDERPLPAIKKNLRENPVMKTDNQSVGSERQQSPTQQIASTPSNDRPQSAVKENPEKERTDSPQRPSTPYDDRPLPVPKAPPPQSIPDPVIDFSSDEPSGNVTGEPEPMSEKDQREAASAIDIFGAPLVSKAYSKTWSFREDALLEVYKVLSDLPDTTSKDEAKAMMRAAIFLINRAIKDKVFAVFTAALNLLRLILTEFVTNQGIPRQDTIYAAEKTMANLLQKTGDTAVRNRDAAKGFIIEEAKFPEVRSANIIPHECVKPFKLNIAPRLALSRTELVGFLYAELGMNNSGLTVENMMRFLTHGLQHTAGEVREKCEKIIVALYKEMRSPVKAHLPPDDEKTRKNVLYKQLFEAFDRIDGKPSKDDLKKQQASETEKQREIEALHAELQELKDVNNARKPADSNMAKSESKGQKNITNKQKASKKEKPPPADPAADDDVSTVYQIDQTCIFCGEKSDQFSEEGLDLHYWRSCPMLKRCAFCKQVVEIAGLTEHLLTECDSKESFQKCPRCTEAIQKTEFEQHVSDRTDQHAAAEPGLGHCPLCHLSITLGEDGWKTHLMGRDGCKQNPRRLQVINKQQGKGGKTTKNQRPGQYRTNTRR